MKNSLILFSAGLLALSCTAFEDHQVRIEVTGDSGIVFSGCHATAFRGLDSVTGTIPAHWVVPVKRVGDAVSAYFQKVNQPGTMTGRMIVDGDTVQEKTVTNPSDALHMHWEPGR